MLAALGGVLSALMLVWSACGPCSCDKTPNYCAVIFGWPDVADPANPTLRRGPYDIVETVGFTEETWKMTCKSRIIAQKIDGSLNNAAAPVVNVYMLWPPSRGPFRGMYSWDGSMCWGDRPSIEAWKRCYINPIIQG